MHLIRKGTGTGALNRPDGFGQRICSLTVIRSTAGRPWISRSSYERVTLLHWIYYALMPETEPAPRSSEQLLTVLSPVMELIASGPRLSDVLRALATFIDHQSPVGRCCISLTDEDGATLRLCAAPKLPTGFAAAIHRVPIGPKSGACGTAAYRRERVVIADLATDPLFEQYRDVALAHGLRSCWSTPIQSAEGAVLGTLTVYHTRRRVPKEREIAAVEIGGHIALIAIERARMDAQLQAGKELFRSLIENTSDIVSIIDQSGIFRYVSPSMHSVLGFHPSETVGTSVFAPLHPDDLAQWRQHFEETLRQPGVWMHAEKRVRHKDGSWRVIETIANNQLSNPAIAGVIVTGRDITNRKRTEEDLISSRERYRELLENANDIIFTHDLALRLTSL